MTVAEARPQNQCGILKSCRTMKYNDVEKGLIEKGDKSHFPRVINQVNLQFSFIHLTRHLA